MGSDRNSANFISQALLVLKHYLQISDSKFIRVTAAPPTPTEAAKHRLPVVHRG